MLFDTANVTSLSYHLTVNGQPTPENTCALSENDKSTGVITLNESPSVSSVLNGARHSG